MQEILALGAMALLVAVAIAAASPARAATVEVKIDNFTFNPQQITVKAGDTVTWVNHDDIPHTVTSKTMAFRSKAHRHRRQVLVHIRDTGQLRRIFAPCIRI